MVRWCELRGVLRAGSGEESAPCGPPSVSCRHNARYWSWCAVGVSLSMAVPPIDFERCSRPCLHTSSEKPQPTPALTNGCAATSAGARAIAAQCEGGNGKDPTKCGLGYMRGRASKVYSV